MIYNNILFFFNKDVLFCLFACLLAQYYTARQKFRFQHLFLKYLLSDCYYFLNTNVKYLSSFYIDV